ncbi:MAG: NifU family protein, partial [Bacteroidia bacterium]
MHIEGVPNPHAIKFVLENGVLSQEEYVFEKFSETGHSPLARKIMMLKYVTQVIIHRNYITVSKSTDTKFEWEEVIPEIKQMIVSHLQENQPIAYVGIPVAKHQSSDDVLVKIIVQLLDEHIRPAAQEDGGDIFFDTFENGVLHLKLIGACKGCPYSHQTVQQGV